jgi:hypothetical protein
MVENERHYTKEFMINPTGDSFWWDLFIINEDEKRRFF